jgi:hypothetical protein
MTFSSTAPRELMHHRKIECFGYRREDGLWDIEGHLVDTKTHDIPNLDRGGVKAGEPLHEMWLRLTLDIDLKCTTSRPAPYGGRTVSAAISPGTSKC